MFLKMFSANNKPSNRWKTNIIPVQKGKSKYKSSEMHQKCIRYHKLSWNRGFCNILLL